jgi:hypothetical protein
MIEGVIFIMVGGAFLAGVQGERLRAATVRREWRKRRRGQDRSVVRLEKHGLGHVPAFDAAEQLRSVMAATFRKRPLLNKAEARVLAAAEQAAQQVGEGWRVMAQVSLGEILASPDEAAFRAINSKRVDLLIIGPAGDPLAAIEYQGNGHHQGTAAARDAVKKEALRRAGIEYIEIKAGDRPAELNWALAKLAQGIKQQAIRPAAA